MGPPPRRLQPRVQHSDEVLVASQEQHNSSARVGRASQATPVSTTTTTIKGNYGIGSLLGLLPFRQGRGLMVKEERHRGAGVGEG